ncbi:DUF192 domain-containing protein [Geminicoccaceae bacterium 1502E]|nr:DUF192 domain-containing protein [Geminicoccaceae bacterium 1502E]
MAAAGRLGEGKLRRRCLLAALLLVPAAGLARASETVPLVVRTASGPLELVVELALTPAERSRGLMFRESLPERHGMLFDFADEAPVVFWMKNTPLSLDLLFIDGQGVIRHIHERAEPFSERHIPSGGPARWVLEIEGGEAARLGIAIGDWMQPPPGVDGGN